VFSVKVINFKEMFKDFAIWGLKINHFTKFSAKSTAKGMIALMRNFAKYFSVLFLIASILISGCSNPTNVKNNSMPKFIIKETKQIKIYRISKDKTLNEKKDIEKVLTCLNSIKYEPTETSSSLFDPFIIEILKKDGKTTLFMNNKAVEYTELDNNDIEKKKLLFKIDQNSFEKFSNLFNSLK